MTIAGSDQHLARLARMSGPVMLASVRHALETGAHGIATTAKESILEGAISGPGHVPAHPGEPPNADTHALDQSIAVIPAAMDDTSGTIRAAVSAGDVDVPYALAQEFGTSTIHEHPYMRPAAAQNRPVVVDGVRTAMNEVIHGQE